MLGFRIVKPCTLGSGSASGPGGMAEGASNGGQTECLPNPIRPDLNEKFKWVEKGKGRRLTVAIGFYTSNGIIVATDRRRTNGDRSLRRSEDFQTQSRWASCVLCE